METCTYNDITTSRGLKYHYLVSPGDETKPTLLFLHGYPSTSYDWRHQIAFFKKEGYPLIVPDLLGYGGTDKPSDHTLYKQSSMAADVIDILKAEGVGKVISIGHDWGASFNSRLASYYPDHFLAFGFLAVSYVPPNPSVPYEALLAHTKKLAGYELFGYWAFFAEDGTAQTIDEHWDSFFSILFPANPKIWVTDMGPTGTLKAYLLADKQGPLPKYISEEEKREVTETLRKNMAGPLNWYKVNVSKLSNEDDLQIPKENYNIKQPVFFGGALQDCICLLSDAVKARTRQYCKDLTMREFDADHWLQLSVPDEVNKELLEWIKGIKV